MTNRPWGTIELYQSNDGSITIDVRMDGDTVWLTRQQLALLFARDLKTIGKHVGNAIREELADMGTVANFATAQLQGNRTVERQVEHYNVAHSRDLVPSNFGRAVEDIGIDVLHRTCAFR